MYKIGTDIVLISRMEKSLKINGFRDKVFTKAEQEYCKNVESYAGLFAAKEAYFKAVGTGINMSMNKIEVLHTSKGKPYFSNISNCDLSISHDGGFAVATAIIGCD